jgi:hypothetical protein
MDTDGVGWVVWRVGKFLLWFLAEGRAGRPRSQGGAVWCGCWGGGAAVVGLWIVCGEFG